MPTTLIWPVRGEWGLTSPNSRFGHNKDGFYTKAEPPFRELLIDFKAHTGTVKQWHGPTAPINDIKLRWTADGGKIIVDYAVGAHRGHFEATVLAGYELDIEFTGTAVTSVNAHPQQIIGGDYPGRDDSGPAKPGVSINCVGDLAREFDSLVAENNSTMQQWAEETIAKHPGAWWAVGLAKTIYDVPVVLGQGMVDALKLGEGTGEAIWQAEDGWGVAKGVGQDALRLLQFIPAFKALKFVKAAGTEARVVSAEVRAAGAEARAERGGALGRQRGTASGYRRFAPASPAGAGASSGVSHRCRQDASAGHLYLGGNDEGISSLQMYQLVQRARSDEVGVSRQRKDRQYVA
jgi:hypothetical protein